MSTTKVHPKFVEMRLRELSEKNQKPVKDVFKNPRNLKIKPRKKATK